MKKQKLICCAIISASIQALTAAPARQWAQAATPSSTCADVPQQQPAPNIQQAAQAQQYNLQELIGENLVDAEGKPVGI